MKKWIILLGIVIVLGVGVVWREIYQVPATDAQKVSFTIAPGESVSALAARLVERGIIRSVTLFERYVVATDMDREIKHGIYTVTAPITLARVVDSLNQPTFQEREITILPGWSLRDVADYLVKQEIAKDVSEVYALTGKPAAVGSEPDEDILIDLPLLAHFPGHVSLEGYLRPDTYRIYKDANVEDVLVKLLRGRDQQITDEMWQQVEQSEHSFHEIMTVASLLEREVQHPEDRAQVADLFWRRYAADWALQADSTVHYVSGKRGDVFTSQLDRDADNPYNTYKYPGLPPGPIAMPSIGSINAALNPQANEYWYFLTTLDTGEVKYAKTLEEHNRNVRKYLR